MKIGLIGAQNSHSKGFCDAINKKHPWEDVSVSFIYGADDPEQANKLCGEFGLTECESEEELIEKSDAVAITYRKGSMHCKAAIKALKCGPDYVSVQSFKNGDVVVTNVVYADKVCVIVTEPKAYNLTVSVSADGKTVCRPVPYYPDAPASELVKMAKSKIAPRDYGFYVKSVELTGKIIESYEKQ